MRVFVALEGPTGVGKTTLAKLVARKLDARFFADPFAGVQRFGRADAADPLAREIEFLFNRSVQLDAIGAALGVSCKHAITDWHLAKTEVFGKAALSRRDYRTLSHFAEIVGRGAPQPDIFVLIGSPQDAVLRRIAARGRHYEAEIVGQDIARMASAFEVLARRGESISSHIVLNFENEEGIKASAGRLVDLLSGYLAKSS